MSRTGQRPTSSPGERATRFVTGMDLKSPVEHQVLEERLQFEILISDLSAAIVNAAAADVDRTIAETLYRVADFCGVDVCALYRLSPDGRQLSASHVHSRRGCERGAEKLAQELPAELLPRLRAGDVVEFRSGPSEASAETRLLIPTKAGQTHRGALGLIRGEGALQFPSYVVLRLQLLGDIVANTLAREQTAEELLAAKTRFSLAVAGSTAGIWDWDIASGDLYFSARCAELVGYAAEDLAPSIDAFRQLVHPDDIDRNDEALRQHIAERATYDIEYRLRMKSGEYRWFRARGQATWNEAGRATRMAGSFNDIDARKQAEAALVNAARGFIPETGDALFQSVATHIAQSLKADVACISTLLDNDRRRVRSRALFIDGRIVPNVDYDLLATPCCAVIDRGDTVVESDLQETFPHDDMLRDLGVHSYVGAPLLDSAGRPLGLVSVMFRRPLPETQPALLTLKILSAHISAELERSQAAQALKSTEQRIRRIFDLAVIGMAITAPDKSILEVNDRLVEILGYSREELSRMTWVDITHPDDLEGDYRVFERVMAGEIDGFSKDKRYIMKNGDVVYVSVAANATRNPDGSVNHFTTLIQDVTHRKRAEQALHDSEQQLRAIIDTTPMCVKLQTRNGTILDINSAGVTILEAEKPTEIIGQNVYHFIRPEYHDVYREFVERVLDGEKGLVEFEVQGFHSTRRFMETRGAPLLLRDNHKVLLSVTTDITDRKEAERIRESLIHELETKNAELERFTYTVSHDLKSPLITIKGFVGLLQHDVQSENKQAVEDDCREISLAADKMEQLLDSLLELSRIGRIANPSAAVNLGDVVAEALQNLSGSISANAVEVVVGDRFPTVHGDRLGLLQVMQNLIHNAVKYAAADNPQVEIAARRDERGTICFVRDNGPGIDPAHQDKVFKLFEQLDPHSGGTGIGLTIVQRIIDVHGGRVWIESDPANTGCTFSFALPWLDE